LWQLCSPTIIPRAAIICEDVGPKFPLGCSEATRTEILSLRAPRSHGLTSSHFLTNIEHNRCCIFVTLLICNISLESELVLAGRPVCDRCRSQGRSLGRPAQRRYRRAQSEQPRSAMLAAHEAIDLVVMFRGRDGVRANSGKCRQLYSSGVVIVGARDARPEAVDYGRRGDP
jgi:hypothetical protein